MICFVGCVGGAGGKGTWGAPGSELYESGEAMDSHDPNYDSDSQVRMWYILPVSDNHNFKHAYKTYHLH